MARITRRPDAPVTVDLAKATAFYQAQGFAPDEAAAVAGEARRAIELIARIAQRVQRRERQPTQNENAA